MLGFIFDQDGTLVRNEAFRYACFMVPRALRLNIDGEEFWRLFLRTYYSTVSMGDWRKAFDWEYITRRTVEILGGKYREGVYTELFMEGVQRGMVRLIDGADYVLENIRKRGGKVVVLTNGYRKLQYPVLERANLVRYIDAVITNDLVELPKPHLEAFERAVSALGLPKDKIIFVGDHPFFDIYGGLKYGLSVVWITENIARGKYRVEELKEKWEDDIYSKYRIKISFEQYSNEELLVVNKLKDLLNLVSI